MTVNDRDCLVNPYNAEIFFYIPWRPKVFFYFKIIINVLFSPHLNTYVMGLRPLEIFIFISVGTVFRRQILTSKHGLRAERVNILCPEVEIISSNN